MKPVSPGELSEQIIEEDSGIVDTAIGELNKILRIRYDPNTRRCAFDMHQLKNLNNRQRERIVVLFGQEGWTVKITTKPTHDCRGEPDGSYPHFDFTGPEPS